MSVVLPGSNEVVSCSAEHRSRQDVITELISQTSDDNYHSSPVSLRAAFVSSLRYQRNTCPADLATAGQESIVSSQHRRCVAKLSASPPAAAADAPMFNAPMFSAPMFSAPALTEETLLDVSHSHLLTYLLQ